MGTSVGLQAVHRDDLLPLPHLEGKGLCPSGHHPVWAGVWGRKRLLLTCALLWPGELAGSLQPLHRMPATQVVEAR